MPLPPHVAAFPFLPVLGGATAGALGLYAYKKYKKPDLQSMRSTAPDGTPVQVVTPVKPAPPVLSATDVPVAGINGRVIASSGSNQRYVPPMRAKQLQVPGRMDLLPTVITPTGASSLSVVTIADVQSALNTLGYGPIAVDGKVGPNTLAATKRFQQAARIPVDGKAGPQTRSALQDALATLAAPQAHIGAHPAVRNAGPSTPAKVAALATQLTDTILDVTGNQKAAETTDKVGSIATSIASFFNGDRPSSDFGGMWGEIHEELHHWFPDAFPIAPAPPGTNLPFAGRGTMPLLAHEEQLRASELDSRDFDRNTLPEFVHHRDPYSHSYFHGNVPSMFDSSMATVRSQVQAQLLARSRRKGKGSGPGGERLPQWLRSGVGKSFFGAAPPVPYAGGIGPNRGNPAAMTPGATSTENHLRSPSRMQAGETLRPQTAGRNMSVTSGRTSLTFQTDGNLVLYVNGAAQWSSGTNKSGMSRLTMQSDGNLVIYGNDSKPKWATNTAGNQGAYLQVRNGAAEVIGPNRQVLWSATGQGAGAGVQPGAGPGGMGPGGMGPGRFHHPMVGGARYPGYVGYQRPGYAGYQQPGYAGYAERYHHHPRVIREGYASPQVAPQIIVQQAPPVDMDPSITPVDADPGDANGGVGDASVDPVLAGQMSSSDYLSQGVSASGISGDFGATGFGADPFLPDSALMPVKSYGSALHLAPGHADRRPWVFAVESMQDVQEALNRLGASPAVPVSGVQTPQTVAAIKTFQITHGLLADGVAGPKTRTAMTLALTEQRQSDFGLTLFTLFGCEAVFGAPRPRPPTGGGRSRRHHKHHHHNQQQQQQDQSGGGGGDQGGGGGGDGAGDSGGPSDADDGDDDMGADIGSFG